MRKWFKGVVASRMAMLAQARSHDQIASNDQVEFIVARTQQHMQSYGNLTNFLKHTSPCVCYISSYCVHEFILTILV